MNQQPITPKPPEAGPEWLDGKAINEPAFCQEFLQSNKLIHAEDSFFTPDGLMWDEAPLKSEILGRLEPYTHAGLPRKIANLIELLKITAHIDDFPPQYDRINLKNGTLFLNGEFKPGSNTIVRSRFPLVYDPQAPQPENWLRFLYALLHEEDIPTVQEFIGYCLLPVNKGQRMMIIKGSGGEGKSQIGAVIKRMFGKYAKDGSIGKISENRFARADLEHIHLLIDDDMRIEALKQTNYVKSLVTAQGKIDLEKKGKQSYQGYMYARLLAFSNGDLQSLYDRSNGFYRRQLILTTKPKPDSRIDDPNLSEKLFTERSGILLWAFQGLKRLVGNNYQFTESNRARANRELLKQDANNIILFMKAEDYITLGNEDTVSSNELYEVYRLWCEENSFEPLKTRTVSGYLVANAGKYGIEHINTVYNPDGRRVWGFKGIRLNVDSGIRGKNGFQRVHAADVPA